MPVEETERFIHLRVLDPDEFETCRLTDFDGRLPRGVRAKYCKYKGRDEWALQAYLFEKAEGWTLGKAESWVDAQESGNNELRLDGPVELQPVVDEVKGVWRVPTVFTREGVHNRGFKSHEELLMAAPWFNNLPIVSDEHAPVHDVERATGFTSDAHFCGEDNSIKGYSNFWPEKLSPKVKEALKTGSLRGGSIGFWCKPIPQKGIWNGKEYSELETNIFPDHYLAPILDGACSVADKCGLYFNCPQCLGDSPPAAGEEHHPKEWSEVKLEQRREAAEKLKSHKTILELFAGEGHIAKVYEGLGKRHILVDDDEARLAKAKAAVKGVETYPADNAKWMREHLSELKDVTLVDFDPYGNPADAIKEFFSSYRVREPMVVTITDGTGSNLRGWFELRLWEKYSLAGDRETHYKEQIPRLLDRLLESLGQRHGFKAERINGVWGSSTGHGDRVYYCGYLVQPLGNESKGDEMICEKSIARKIVRAVSSAFRLNEGEGQGTGQGTATGQGTGTGQGEAKPPAPTQATTSPASQPATPPSPTSTPPTISTPPQPAASSSVHAETTAPQPTPAPDPRDQRITDLEARLKKFEDAEARKAAAEKAALIAEVAPKLGKKPEDLKDWEMPHLEAVKAAPFGTVDRSLMAPTTGIGTGKTTLTVGRWDPVKKEWTTGA